MCLNNKIQSCESILRQKGTRSVETPPEQIVEYILITKGDAENLLAEYYQKIEDFKMNWVIKSYLVRNPFIYSLIYLYRPKSLQAFMNACYEEYLNNPETFDTDDVEKLFDRYIATG